MGAKSSKSELTRRKSFSTFGRSSQRSLFQKSKFKLNRISKQIDSTDIHADVASLESIKNDLDGVEKDLNGISDVVKVKNQEKYDDACRHLQSTRQKFEDKFKSQLEHLQEVEIPLDDTNEIILRNTETNNEEHEPKKLSVTFRELSEEAISYSEEPKRPSVKFGVQVLPPSPQTQVVLKRKTYPIDSSPRNELTNRNTTDATFSIQNGASSKVTIQTSSSFNSKTVSPNLDYSPVFTGSYGKREYIRSNSLLSIETINNEVTKLETKLKYFTGGKNSKSYIELYHGLVSNLALLESIDTEEDPISKQEKKILLKRIQELLKILDCLVEEIDGVDSDEMDSTAKKYCGGVRTATETVIISNSNIVLM